jgi:flagellar assembly factor FliW
MSASASPNPRVETRFGAFEAAPESVVRFPEGLPGFETCRRFVLITSDELDPLQCLHGLDVPEPSFLAIDPRLALPDYRTVLNPADRVRLDTTVRSPLLWLAIVTMADDGSATANLRAPLVINPERMIGYQVMPHQSLYPVAHPLVEE